VEEIATAAERRNHRDMVAIQTPGPSRPVRMARIHPTPTLIPAAIPSNMAKMTQQVEGIAMAAVKYLEDRIKPHTKANRLIQGLTRLETPLIHIQANRLDVKVAEVEIQTLTMTRRETLDAVLETLDVVLETLVPTVTDRIRLTPMGLKSPRLTLKTTQPPVAVTVDSRVGQADTERLEEEVETLIAMDRTTAPATAMVDNRDANKVAVEMTTTRCPKYEARFDIAMSI